MSARPQTTKPAAWTIRQDGRVVISARPQTAEPAAPATPQRALKVLEEMYAYFGPDRG